MNYAELVSAVKDTLENEFTTSDIDMLIKQAEQKIYLDAQLPALRTVANGLLTSGNPYIVWPSNALYVISLGIVKETTTPTVYDTTKYLLNKDYEFLLEAYPNSFLTGEPSHYAIFDVDQLVVGPTPNVNYLYVLRYATYPTSIVTANQTWLGDNLDSVLLNATLMEAIRFIKGPKDQVDLYTNMYKQSLAQLKNLADGKLRQDLYRTMQVRNTVV